MTTHDQKRTTDQITQEIDQELAEIDSLLQDLPKSPGLSSVRILRENWPSLEETLASSGWNHNRKVDISNHINTLSALGVCVHKFARDFMEIFNNLSIRFPKSYKGSTYTYHFDALAAAENYVDVRLEVDEAAIGHKICPVAESDDGMITLLIDDIGRVFASVDRSLRFVAENYLEALEKLNTDQRFQPISK